MSHFPCFTPHPSQNVTDIYNARRSDPVSVTTKFKEGEVSFKGGIRRMLDERRHRLSGGSDTPSDASSTSDEDLDVQFIRVEKALKLKTKELELARVEDELSLHKSGAWFVAGPTAGAVPATGSSTDAAPTTGTAACATTVRAGAAVSSVPKSAAPVTGSADGAAPAPGAAISKKPKQGRGPYKKVSAVVPLYSEYHEKSWD